GWAVASARIIYREIGREVSRRGITAWDERVSTTRARKLAAISQGALSLALAHIDRVVPRRKTQTAWTRVRRVRLNGKHEFADVEN
ncbi:hypothetical protein ACI4B7_27850, partial [Klebsiella pneumoniae]